MNGVTWLSGHEEKLSVDLELRAPDRIRIYFKANFSAIQRQAEHPSALGKSFDFANRQDIAITQRAQDCADPVALGIADEENVNGGRLLQSHASDHDPALVEVSPATTS